MYRPSVGVPETFSSFGLPRAASGGAPGRRRAGMSSIVTLIPACRSARALSLSLTSLYSALSCARDAAASAAR
eukprot:scaffold1302_cov64-Phaeocystis_antarctica.AAC.1